MRRRSSDMSSGWSSSPSSGAAGGRDRRGVGVLAGGGGRRTVAAVQFSHLADAVHCFTALGADELGQRAKAELEERGIEVHAAFVEGPSARASRFVDGRVSGRSRRSARSCARVATTLVPWHELARCDAVYFCAGDVDALVPRDARAWSSRPRASSARSARRRARRGRRAAVGRRRALPAGDLDPPPRLASPPRAHSAVGAAGWAVHGGTAPETRATPTAPATASRRGSHSLSPPGSRHDALAFAARCGAGALAGPGVHAEAIPYRSERARLASVAGVAKWGRVE